MNHLLQTTLPPTPCTVIFAEMQNTDSHRVLRLTLSLRCHVIKETILGASFPELLHQLTLRLGFNADDAARILALAQGGN